MQHHQRPHRKTDGNDADHIKPGIILQAEVRADARPHVDGGKRVDGADHNHDSQTKAGAQPRPTLLPVKSWHDAH